MSCRPIIEQLESRNAGNEHPPFRVGDTLRVHVRIVEGQRERVQVFEGVVIRRRRGGSRATFTVRKISYGVGVERTFPYRSPRLERIEVTARGVVCRNRLYYLRERTGKSARIRARIDTQKTGRARAAASEPAAPPS